MRLIGMPSHLHLAKADWLDDTKQLVSVATRNVVPQSISWRQNTDTSGFQRLLDALYLQHSILSI